WGLAVVLHITLFMVYALRVNLSMAIVAMTNATHPTLRLSQAPVYDWSAETQGIILSSFFYGYIFTQMLGGYWAGTLGGKVVLGCGLFLTSALTLFVPLAAKLGVVYLIGLQVLLGLAEGVIFPAQYTLWAKWAPPMERSRLMNIADAGKRPCVSTGPEPGLDLLLVSPGGIGCIWSMFWFLLVYEDPARHPCISARERDYIVSSLASQGCSHGWSLPLKAMAKSLPLWAIAVACFCTDWLFYTLLTSMPTYMNNVLHFNIQENGLLSALPYVGNGLGHILSGLLADLLLSRHVLSTAAVRKLFSAVGMLLPGAFLVAVSYIGCNYTAAVAFLTLSLTVNSTTGAGLNINHIDIAPRYAGFLLGITNTFGIIAGIIAPTAVGFLTSQDLVAGWRNVFFLSAGIDLFGLLFYVAFGNGTIQDWAKEDVANQ
uniref:Solute carrier family 17 member 4 n=1 Tax=Crocodylus porosus TaxID=8502 RepID=A0A7M4FFV1_CROPO